MMALFRIDNDRRSSFQLNSRQNKRWNITRTILYMPPAFINNSIAFLQEKTDRINTTAWMQEVRLQEVIGRVETGTETENESGDRVEDVSGCTRLHGWSR